MVTLTGDVFVDMTTVEYSVPAEDPQDPDIIKEETVPDIVHLTGSAMADILAGDSRDNTIMGGGGDDKIYGGPGGGDDDAAWRQAAMTCCSAAEAMTTSQWWYG